jgi:branched-chain amino acid transport system permease protein
VIVNFLLSIVIVAPIGLYLYRIAYQPIAHASVLVLLIASVGVHLALQGLGLVFFGPEGLRAPAIATAAFTIGPLRFTGQSIAIYAITILLIVGLWLLFGYTLYGKALRATAVNRLGARIVGIRTTLSGQVAFLLAAVIGTISGILIVPITTIYYDTGFLIGLKGFVAAIIGGLVSYPLTATAALVVGIVEAFSSFYASNFKEVIVFTLLLPVLILRSLATPEVEEEGD